MLSGSTASLDAMTRRNLVAALALSVALVACGGRSGTPDAESTGSAFGGAFADAKAYPVFASSEVVVGENRFLVGLLDENDAPIGSADIAMHIRFFDLQESETEPVFETDMRFIETVPGKRGLYMTNATFDSAGSWGAEVTVEGDDLEETVNAAFDVVEEGTTPEIGAPAPASKTLTARDVKDLEIISTDPHPDPDFYEVSVKEAINDGDPFVVVFATPKFCTSQVCAPTLNIVKKASKGFRGVRFIHVEVYKNLDDPSALKVVPAVKQWGLPSEPWVFVVDADGRVAAKYEGTVTAGELGEALRKL
jgi:hypothetical protein